MQHDEIIWQVINQHFCSFKIKGDKANFCKNKYNITGLCNRSSCPLANSRYATVLEEDGICYLYVKTIERAHTPANLWEKIKLSKNYPTALKQISDQLAYWPNFLIHKAKQRLTKIHQYLIRMRRLKLQVRPELVGVTKKIDRREANREHKAHKAANIEEAIKKELLARLQQGVYPVSEQDSEIVNVPQRQYEEVVGTVGEEDRDEIDDAELDSLADEDDEQVEQEDEFEQEMDTGDLSERKQAKQSKAKPSGSKAEAGTASDEESAMEESDGGSGAEMQDEKEMELEREFVEAYDDDIMSDDDMEDVAIGMNGDSQFLDQDEEDDVGPAATKPVSRSASASSKAASSKNAGAKRPGAAATAAAAKRAKPNQAPASKRKDGRPRVEVEYEHETEDLQRENA